MNKKTVLIVTVGILSALGVLIYLLEVSLGFIFVNAPYLKVDFSDIPAVVGALIMGPIVGVLIEFIKNLLHVFIGGTTGGIGEIANFVAGISYIVPVAILFKRKMKLSTPIFIVGIIATTIVTNTVNYLLVLPLYGITGHSIKLTWIVANGIGFNLIKWVIISIISGLLYKPILKGIKNISIFNSK